MKTCFLHVNDKLQEDSHWEKDKLGERVVDVLQYLAQCAHKQYLPNFFEPHMNVFVDYKPDTLSNIAFRIDKVLNSPVAMTKLLERKVKKLTNDATAPKSQLARTLPAGPAAPKSQPSKRPPTITGAHQSQPSRKHSAVATAPKSQPSRRPPSVGTAPKSRQRGLQL